MEEPTLIMEKELKLLKVKQHQSLSEALVRAVLFEDDDRKVDRLVVRINERADLHEVGTHNCGIC